MIKNHEVDLIVNTTEGRRAIADSASIRSSAEANHVYYTTTLAAAEAICAVMKRSGDDQVRRLQDLHRSIVE
jgi:carbamoyl-phosphate synthase large subunit